MNKNNYNLINKYLIAGHSTINVNNYTEMRLRPNVWLVMHSACGETFNKNLNFHNIFHNQNKLKHYLTHVTLYGPGDLVPNQIITMKRASKEKLLHGLYTLPLSENVVTTKSAHVIRTKSLLYRKGGGNYRLSTLLKKPGIYIGMFCRTISGTKPNVIRRASSLVPTQTAPFKRKVPTVYLRRPKPKLTVRFV